MSKKAKTPAQIAEDILQQEADAVWRTEVCRATRREELMDYFERLRDSDIDEYHRQNGSDRLLELQRQGGE
jgi:hypothetical protein